MGLRDDPGLERPGYIQSSLNATDGRRFNLLTF